MVEDYVHVVAFGSLSDDTSEVVITVDVKDHAQEVTDVGVKSRFVKFGGPVLVCVWTDAFYGKDYTCEAQNRPVEARNALVVVLRRKSKFGYFDDHFQDLIKFHKRPRMYEKIRWMLFIIFVLNQ